ncbi:MAG: S8 family serine peptidase [Armatimonadetes bacterium]|nr:S8 family serine peptidase [Armatimonadota bacterium]
MAADAVGWNIMYKRLIFSGLAALLSAAPALAAGAGGVNGPFIEQKGVLEFTRTLIVRPLQAVALAQRGYDSQTIAAVQRRAADRLRPYRLKYYAKTDWSIVQIPFYSDENDMSKALMATGDYEYAVPNWRCYVNAAKKTPNDPRFSSQWQHKVMRSEEAWNLHTGTNNVTVAIVDTGVLITHEDLKAGMVKGYNSVDRKAEVDGGDVVDVHGHGTHCAGDAAALGNNGIGLVGEGWNFKIMPIRASLNGSASFDDLFNGAMWAADHGAKVVSVSFSGVDSPAVNTTGTYVKGKGGLLLWAAGNDARDLSGFSHPDTIVVGATNSSDTRAGFSAYGKGVAVFAPGEGIWSTTVDGGYGAASGTSMATPIANGVCALIWSINPSLKPKQVQTILYNNCDQIGSPSIYGHGRVNMLKAAQAAMATRTIAIDYKPATLSLLQGTYVSGNLGMVQNGTGAGYVAKSVKVNGVGESSIAKMDFKLGYSAGATESVVSSFKLSTSKGSNSTVQVFFWNFSTGRYDMIKTTPMPNDGSVFTFSHSYNASIANYLATDKTLRVAVRAFSPVGRRGEPGSPFQLTLKQGKLTANVLP